MIPGEKKRLFSQTRTRLEQFDNQHDFERMAADILNALGYTEVIPIAPRGGSDAGRDIIFTTENGGKGLACVTLRKDIEVKFKQDFSQRTAGEYEKYVLFCIAHLTALQKRQFTHYCLETLQALFVPFDIEALRSSLDSSLKSIREAYLHIQDDSKGVSEEALVALREEMQKQREADMLLLEANKFASSLMEKDRLVQKAVGLSPAYRQRELRKLGIEMSMAVIDGYDPVTQRGSMVAGLGRGMAGYGKLDRNDVARLATTASNYLQKNVLETSMPDADGLLYLACLFGYQQQFEEMIRVLEQAVTLDDEIQEKFQLRKILQMLLRACHSDQIKVEVLRKSLRLPPVSKETFCKYLQELDLTGFTGFIEWLGVKRPSAPGETGTFLIKITPPYPSDEGKVSASGQSITSWGFETVIANTEPITIEELYEALHSLFILFCPVD
jgi:hypothetical protein